MPQSRPGSVLGLPILSWVTATVRSRRHGVVKKTAVSLPDEQVDLIRLAVSRGRAASVSGFISEAVARAEHEDSLTRLLDDLDDELGPVGEADLAWADKVLGLR